MNKLPTDKKARKERPLARGLLDYFPKALAAVAHVSFVGNQQHNPGEPMHWARDKSPDHADCILRHLIDRGSFDDDGLPHSAKVAWRALAMLELELEQHPGNLPGDIPGNLPGENDGANACDR
ncbi:MAG: dATP/dGTP diphosphohydrolase domain-containing protein [Planctomycetota bacterium]